MGDQLSPGEVLRQRIAAMPHGKVEAYRKFREVGRHNLMTKFYFEHRLFRRGVPFLVAPPRARDFRYPPTDRSDVIEFRRDKLTWQEDGFDLIATIEQDNEQPNDYHIADDPHLAVAALTLDKEPRLVTKKERVAAKKRLFEYTYGKKDEALSLALTRLHPRDVDAFKPVATVHKN